MKMTFNLSVHPKNNRDHTPEKDACSLSIYLIQASETKPETKRLHFCENDLWESLIESAFPIEEVTSCP